MNESCKVYGNEETEMKGKGPSMRDKTDAGMQCDILEGGLQERGSLWVETMNSTLRIILNGF